MADPPQHSPASPVSVLLQTLGMTRDDLSKRAVQMKEFLETEQPSLRVMSNQTDAAAAQAAKTRPAGRSRNTSVSNPPAAPFRTASPPVTPVKVEPVERSIPRQKDTMEMIMERKDRQKRRERRESASRPRETRRIEQPEAVTPTTPQTSAGTPHHYRYYSERVIEQASGSKSATDPFIITNAYMDTPTRKTPRARAPVFKAPQTPSRFPKTPTSRQAYSHEPSSSRASSPMSSPARMVDLVSSPGPMRAAAQIEEHPDDLPYTLPPGPYRQEKPEQSYAAIIGQAILSSPENRLALQDIYEWVTTVYPYYRRGEQTWMNSVRHALSTMAVFRKVPRTRMEGKSLWAIFDQDLPCFASGTFRKSLCADMVKVKTESSKPGPKKRGTMEEAMSRNAKRRKTTLAHDVYGNPVPPLISGPVLQPFYAHVHPGTHHQPYYGAAYMAQPLPAEVVFPPLPPSSNYHQLVTMKAAEASSSSRATSVEAPSVAPSTSTSSYEDPPSSHEPSPAPSSSVASSSVPELTPDDGSSSSPQMPDDMGTDPDDVNDVNAALVVVQGEAEPEIVDPDAEFEKWLAEDPLEEAVAPHLTLLRGFSEKTSPDHNAVTPRRRNGKMPALPVPTSPTLERRSAAKQKAAARTSPHALTFLISQRASSSREMLRPTTPPRRPCTPPRKRAASRSPQSSPQRTPMSYSRFRLRKSPSPPRELPALPTNPELLRTPSRKRVPSGGGPGSGSGSKSGPGKSPSNIYSFSPGFGHFSTPKRGSTSFGATDFESPFRPSWSMYDPHDPAALLDDEVKRLSNQNDATQGSPSGLYGRAGKGLLYESPSVPSPGKWENLWS
ncbi:hypothetical protein EIP91_005078 [Steccherinum ochraceum]|uniref:Fork-head domain-containing protein n=1 Tax=Steccherinum ochraceum TaxID=92696 RepID=A0A4V2MVV6_9APHY|nr:hypothetical protein EIP91_005078 [Steccherinum ochraceum]